MMTKPPALLIVLLIAYFIAEFFIFPWWVKFDKRRGFAKWVTWDGLPHTFALATVLVLTDYGKLYAYLLPLSLGACRSLIRFLSRLISADNVIRIALRNIVLLFLVVLIWITYIDGWVNAPDYLVDLVTVRLTLMMLAYLLITRPAAAFIGPLLASKIVEIGNVGTSLIGAGTMIGYLERGLIITFIFLKHWDAIGFLLAAKGILRFNDLKPEDHRPITEYVMLGTLLSFSIAIFVGSFTMYLLTFVPTHKAEGRHDQQEEAAPVMVIRDPKQISGGDDQPWKRLIAGA